MSDVSNTPYMVDKEENARELARLNDLITALEIFKDSQIHKIVDTQNTRLFNQLKQEAPYDYMEYDNIHLRENIKKEDFRGSIGGDRVVGKEIDCDTAYAGLLEFGTSWHGQHRNWFRPKVFENWKDYKEEVIRVVTQIYKK